MANRYFVEEKTRDGWRELPTPPIYRSPEAIALAHTIAARDGRPARVMLAGKIVYQTTKEIQP